MPVFLHGLGLKNYRGIGSTEQLMAPFRSFNIFIGANNAGKSSILSFISKYLKYISASDRIPEFPAHEFHGAARSVEIHVGVSISQFLEPVSAIQKNYSEQLLRRVLDAISDNGTIWLTYAQNAPWILKGWPDEKLKSLLTPGEWNNLWVSITHRTGGGVQHWIRETMDAVLKAQNLRFESARLIPAIREIGPANASLADYSGKGLIDKLASIQNPAWNKRSDKLLFDQINEFLRQVTGNGTALIEIPADREHLLVHMDDKVLPLMALGTGIQEVVMIATFCTLSQGEIVCIEEPELHLHPLLQKKLVRYLIDRTQNQYFIATHSPSFIDTEGAAIFHVRNEAGQTIVRETILRRSLYAVCDDLGHKASELLQANAVIWVEGPSDRIYLKHWLAAVDPSLIEGIHYSIVFYGGRLLSHLAIEQDGAREFIDLKRLNRNVAIVIDSDRGSDVDAVNATKQRICNEFEAEKNISWITAGREIENYVESTLLDRALKAVYPKLYGNVLSTDRYAHALHFSPSEEAAKRRNGGNEPIVSVDKVAVAKEVVKEAAVLNVLDLRERLEDLKGMIRRANGL